MLDTAHTHTHTYTHTYTHAQTHAQTHTPQVRVLAADHVEESSGRGRSALGGTKPRQLDGRRNEVAVGSCVIVSCVLWSHS